MCKVYNLHFWVGCRLRCVVVTGLAMSSFEDVIRSRLFIRFAYANTLIPSDG